MKKEAKFLTYLRKGKSITRRQAMSMFKLGNPSATVLRLQEAGMGVQRQYTYNKKTKTRTVKYSLA